MGRAFMSEASTSAVAIKARPDALLSFCAFTAERAQGREISQLQILICLREKERAMPNTRRPAAKSKGRRKGRPWTKADHRELKAHSKNRTPVAKISRAMKRTAGALRQQALKLGLGLGHRR
jgi:DNA invertase Pin-like site-specific DNA recombinase